MTATDPPTTATTKKIPDSTKSLNIPAINQIKPIKSFPKPTPSKINPFTNAAGAEAIPNKVISFFIKKIANRKKSIEKFRKRPRKRLSKLSSKWKNGTTRI